MRGIFFLFVFLNLYYSTSAQSYGNDWIDYSQRYLRIPITQEGIYRITQTDLFEYFGDFDPRTIEIYTRGKRVPVFVHGQEDQIFNSEDYIEFFAEKNNGWLDTAIYKNSIPINSDYSLYNDTASYFLCFSNNTAAERYDTTRNTNFSAYTPLSYCWKTVRGNYTNIYNDADQSPFITGAEGWVDNFFEMGQKPVVKTFSTPNYVNVEKPYTIKFGVSGYSNTQHDLIVESTDFMFDTTYLGYKAVHKTIQNTNALPSITQISFRSTYSNTKTADKNCVAYVEITYPHSYNFQYQQYMKFTTPATQTGEYIHIDVKNFNGGDAPYVYCPELNKRIQATKYATNSYRFLLPNPNREVECIIVNPITIKTVPAIKKTKTQATTSTTSPPKFFDLQAGSPNEGNYIIITHSSLWNKAVSYKNYRISTGYQVVLIDVDDLYNQFGYGIQKHPYAIHNFIEYASKEWSIKPEYIFIIGKGLHSNITRKNTTSYANSLVPSIGHPSSDFLFTADLHGTSLKQKAAIGRIAASTGTKIDAYRSKVAEHESAVPSEWMKTIMHFGGGSTIGEQRLIKTYLKNYETIISGEFFGADVTTFLKSSSTVFEKTEPEAIRELMNKGTALCNFFGHSSGNSFDQNIDHPSLFNNKGKYPFMVANSCYSGDIFTESDYGISETWVFIPERGSIGFFANADLGVPTYLNTFSHSFINNIVKYNYGNSLGSSISKTFQEISNKYIHVDGIVNSSLSFILHGDPAVALHTFEYPDLEVSESSISFNPPFISNDLTTFTTNVIVRNKARATSDTVHVSLIYTAASGNQIIIDTIMRGSYNKDTLSIIQNIRDFESGAYTLQVIVDEPNTIIELNEVNNTTIVDFFISSRDVLPVYPYEYAIIPTNTTEFVMSAVDPLKPPKTILIELDTIADFSSDFLISATLQTEDNAIVRWIPPINFTDGETYFWRVSNADDIRWNESSFTYEANKTGWGQIKARQFIKNSHQYVSYDEAEKKYSFVETPHGIYCATKGLANTNADYFATFFMIDNTLKENSGFPLSSPALHIVVIDSVSGEPWQSDRANFGQRNYPIANGRVRFHLAFTSNNAAARNNAANVIQNIVPDGSYIMMYTFKSGNFEAWEENLLTAFEDLGAQMPRTLGNDIPYIFFGKKGDESTAIEVAGTSSTDLINLSVEIPGNYFQGTVTSTRIGPAKIFKEAVWNSQKINLLDSTSLDLFGFSSENKTYTIAQQIIADTVFRLDTLIDASLIPYMKLHNFQYDVDERTPPLLHYWKVYFDPVGELAIAPEHTFIFNSDTLKQGETMEIIIAAQNIGTEKMDSILVLFELRNEQNELVYSEYHRIGTLDAQAYIVDTFRVHTGNFSGNYTAKIEFNPVNPETGLVDQAEFYYFNNFILLPCFIQSDIKNPLIDVIVDGRHVLHGDYISGTPKIEIRVYDENDYLFLQDTSLFTIYATNLSTGAIIPFYFSDTATITFIPAQDSAHQCIIILNPTFKEDGTYELHIQARDVSGNYAGSQEYILYFQIQQEAQISVLYNFPNPCKTLTTFRFILTGNQVPKDARIEIFSDVGALVKTIELPESKLHTGTNSIDVNWDGTDSHHVVLPNGVYVYRLIFSDKNSYTHYATPHDEFIHKAYGKLIIQR